MCRLFMAAIAVLASSTALAEEIPLKDIWGFKIPGTHPIREGLPPSQSPESLLISEISSSLGRISAKQEPGEGFVVEGDGIDALHEAHAVLLKEQKRPSELRGDAETSIVFFTRPVGAYVHLDRVERKGSDVIISYHFVQHLERITTCHLALIPLGKLTSGTFKVELVRLPDTFHGTFSLPQLPKGFESKVVCKPFEFKVKGE